MVPFLGKCVGHPKQTSGAVLRELQLPEPLCVGRTPLRGQAVVFDPACDQLRSSATLCEALPVRGSGEAAGLPKGQHATAHAQSGL